MAGKDFIDFAALKERVNIGQCVQMLGLRMKGDEQLRSPCPACRSGGDRALAVNVSKGSFYCFADGKGGDQIALVAHVRGMSQREAAQEIAEHFKVGQAEKPTRSSETASTSESGMEALSYLEFDHPAVETLGFDAETAQALGIGHAPRGMMKGLVAIPIRLEDGSIAGYLGVNDIAKLPPKWQLPTSNVVALKKPA